jgi:putative lipoprotein
MAWKFFNTWRLGVVSAALLFLLAGTAFTDAQQTSDTIFVFADGTPHVMKRVASASGEKYEDSNDLSTFFWSKGPDAILSIGGREYSRYVLIRGSTDDDSFILTVDGGNFTMNRVISASGAKYEALGDPTTVFWSKGPSAMLIVQGSEYEEYNEWLPSGEIWLAGRSLPTGVEWKVAELAGSPVIDGSTVTVTFHDDGALGGIASVNSYSSTWIISGNRIMIGRCLSTKMAGASNLMEQEDKFLRLLHEVTRFRISPDGFVLTTEQGDDIVLKR